FELGWTEDIQWEDGRGNTWKGRLYYPINFVSGRPAPLVIQTHGLPPPSTFSLYGSNVPLGPGISVYAAQTLAGRGIAVLQVQDKPIDGVLMTPHEPELYAEAYEAAIASLASRGVVDRSRVGLLGYSRTVWHVEYALTHRPFR